MVINSTALLCVIPTALRWRRERQILSQLEHLAKRLHTQSPDIPAPLSPDAASAAISRINDSMRRRKRRPSQPSGYDNPTFIGPPPTHHPNSKQGHQPQITLPIFPYMYGMYPSQNEFNASIFGLDPSQLIGMPPMQRKFHILSIHIPLKFIHENNLNLSTQHRNERNHCSIFGI